MNAHERLDHLIHSYGDLVYDLCESTLLDAHTAQAAFQGTLKRVSKTREGAHYTAHERAWVLRCACEEIRAGFKRHGRPLTASEQIELDSVDSLSVRLKRFNSYFQRLELEDRLLLLLRDKYGLPYPEIATAMEMPEGSLKIRRQQSLRALEEWLWEAK